MTIVTYKVGSRAGASSQVSGICHSALEWAQGPRDLGGIWQWKGERGANVSLPAAAGKRQQCWPKECRGRLAYLRGP